MLYRRCLEAVIRGSKIKSKIMQNVYKRYLNLASFDLVSKLMSLPVINTWTVCPFTD